MVGLKRDPSVARPGRVGEAASKPFAARGRAGPGSARPRLVISLFGALLGVVLLQPSASAEIRSVSVRTATDIGPFRGKPYREIEATMAGTAPGGAYAVPVTLAFPVRTADHNGYAVVDIINSTTVGKTWPLGGTPLFPIARMHMSDDFLFGTGTAYVGVVWDKNAVEALQSGTIASPADGYAILADAAALARDPATYLGSEPAPASARVIAYGYSQTGSLLRGWYAKKLNQAGGSPIFDGALIGGAQAWCRELDPPGSAPCPGIVSDGGKVIVLSTETDAQWTGFLERGQTDDYRVYEIPGVAHIPASVLDFRAHGQPMQNPASFNPAVRASFANLLAWIGGTEPPPSLYIELAPGEPENFMDSPLRQATRDKDGNALGGLRLPHIAAPLGIYEGLDYAFKDSNGFFLIGGRYRPFSREELADRYPTRESYVELVAAAASDLVTTRYLLQEDATAYVEAAKQAEIGPR
jgi:hypothetical protein